ncbi:uncharacterized protein LOC134642717 [Pelmatolapia mariae]|uniref:uncharacterized protein LOC134642717 n=1 Tax=Pelmatolapia mariae TaxID=158779 RepID=UPI002FE5DA65
MEEKLISAVANHPELYDASCYFYQDRNKKDRALRHISEEIGQPGGRSWDRRGTAAPHTGRGKDRDIAVIAVIQAQLLGQVVNLIKLLMPLEDRTQSQTSGALMLLQFPHSHRNTSSSAFRKKVLHVNNEEEEVTEHKDTDKVMLSCSVVTYGECHHTLKWLVGGQAVDKENKQIVTSQTDCSTTLSFLEHHYLNSSRHKILKCEVTDTKTGKVQLFTFSHQTSGEETGDAKTRKKSARKSETTTTIKILLKSDDTTAKTVENESATPNNKSSADSQHAIQWFIIPAVGLVSLLIIVVFFIRWKRTRGNKTQMDEDAGLSLNPAETQSAPQTSQDSVDPEVSYAIISYSKTNNKVRVRGDDEGDAVTYSTVKAHSSSAAATADPSSLYSTVSFSVT